MESTEAEGVEFETTIFRKSMKFPLSDSYSVVKFLLSHSDNAAEITRKSGSSGKS